MHPTRLLPAALLAVALAAVSPAADKADKGDGFVPLFNGKDLTGWVNVNCAPGTFYVKGDEIITTGKPTGYLRTAKQYENFVAEFDWMHIPNKPGEVGNSGFFVWADPIPAVGTGYTRGIEVQVLVNLTYKNKKGEITATSQGDLFSIWGATCVPDRPHPDGWARCLPSENHCKGEKEWNHYRVEANDGRITLAVNGHPVSGVSKCKPRKGYLALESEGSECRFKNLKIKELPSTNPKKDEVADVDQGFKSLYTGLDLSGWKAGDEQKAHWHPRDTVLAYDGKGDQGDGVLRSAKEYGDYELIFDWRFPKRERPEKGPDKCGVVLRGGKGEVRFTALPNRFVKLEAAGETRWIAGGEGEPPGQWNRLAIRIEGDRLAVNFNGGKHRVGSISASGAPARGTMALFAEGGPVDFANIFVRPLN
jgi:hypothetical protein